MRKRHRSLALAIILPTFFSIVVGQGLVYLGGYFSLRDSATHNAILNDQEDLGEINDSFGEGDYVLLGYGLVPVIEAYEANKPAAPLTPGSAEEATYKEVVEKAAANQLYQSVETRLERYLTTFVGIFYEDVATNRMVLVCTSDKTDTAETTAEISLYLGSFFNAGNVFKDDVFYGYTLHDSVAGDLFASALYMSEITHPNQGGGPYRVWLIRETSLGLVYQDIPSFSQRFAIISAAVLLGMAIVLYLLIRFVVIRPSKRLSMLGNEFSNALREGERIEVFQPHKSRYSNELTDINDALFTAQESIQEYSSKLRESTAREERMNADLAIAERIQSSMVPTEPLHGPMFTVRGYMHPAKEVGGDLYNYFRIDDDHVALFIGDVSGKGVGAALFMAKANTVLRLTAKDFDFDKANQTLCEGNAENLFVTAFMALLEISTGKLRYVNAGHEPVFICRDGKYEMLDEEPNFMLGYLDDFSFVVQETILKPGDRLFLYTDGISEAMNEKGELFGKERIHECLNASKGLPSSEVFKLIMVAVKDFVGAAEQSDDACILGLDYGLEKRLTIEPDTEGLKTIASFIDEFLADVDENTRSIIHVIADEMCSNAIYYSNSPEPIRFILCKDEKKVTGYLIDAGTPFNPLEKGPKEDPDEPGGLGIIMSKSLSDEFDYEYVCDHNVLRFVKNRASK